MPIPVRDYFPLSAAFASNFRFELFSAFACTSKFPTLVSENGNWQSGNPLAFSFSTPYFRFMAKDKMKANLISGSGQAE
jgi:hypothetical protein